MVEQEKYKEILQKVIEQTQKNNLKTIDEVIQVLELEIHSHLSMQHKK